MKIENMSQIAKCFSCYREKRKVHLDCEPYRMFFRSEEIELGDICPRYLAFDQDVRNYVLGYDNFEYPEMVRTLMARPKVEPAKREK